ncbi:SDR family oxidoreductase [Gluconacetobacter sacchari]|uniref:SDR family oxidoreductase n=1 Tax=Gluconacetobacter sacchari TaxID=92759 RepID=UPI0039B6B3C1
MDLQISGRTAIVMGASSGLGFGIARALAREGVHVGLLARDPSRLDTAAARLRAVSSTRISCIVADLASQDAVHAAIGAIQDEIGVPDILVGNGGGPPPGSAADFDAALWEAQARAMLLPVMTMTDAFLPAMRANGFGRIIMVSSTSVVEPIAGLVLSNALRAALANWGRTLAREVARDGVTVNTVMPGRFDTARVQTLHQSRADAEGRSAEEIRRRDLETIPAGRYGTPEEFGAVAAFLASPLASYVTGALIPVDGGLLHGH